MKKIFPLIFNILIILAMLALIIYCLLLAKNPNYKTAAKAAIILVAYLGAVLGLRQKRSSGYKNYRVYKDKYADIICNAFAYDRKSYNMLMKGIDLYNHDMYEKAVKLLEKLEESSTSPSDHTAVLSFKALCLEEQHLYNAAIQAYEEILKYDIRNSRVWSNLGIIYADTGRTEDAASAYENAVAYDPNNAHAYNNLAVFYIRSGNPQKAVDNALHAIELNGRLYQAMSAAAMAYKMMGNEEMAEKYCQMYGANGGNVKNLKDTLNNL